MFETPTHTCKIERLIGRNEISSQRRRVSSSSEPTEIYKLEAHLVVPSMFELDSPGKAKTRGKPFVKDSIEREKEREKKREGDDTFLAIRINNNLIDIYRTISI